MYGNMLCEQRRKRVIGWPQIAQMNTDGKAMIVLPRIARMHTNEEGRNWLATDYTDEHRWKGNVSYRLVKQPTYKTRVRSFSQCFFNFFY